MSALDLIHDGTRLLIGHAKGLVSYHSLSLSLSLSVFLLSLPSFSFFFSQITHWDLENNKVLRFIDDAHPPGFAVLSIKVGVVVGCHGYTSNVSSSCSVH